MHALDRDLIDQLTPAAVLSALPRGAANGLTVGALVCAVTGVACAPSGVERHLRKVVVALRRSGHPVCAVPGQGYYLADTDAEIDATCGFLYARAMTSLTQVAAIKRVSLPDLRGQLRLPGEENSHECPTD